MSIKVFVYKHLYLNYLLSQPTTKTCKKERKKKPKRYECEYNTKLHIVSCTRQNGAPGGIGGGGARSQPVTAANLAEGGQRTKGII